MRERKTRVIGKHGGRDKTLLKSKTKGVPILNNKNKRCNVKQTGFRLY